MRGTRKLALLSVAATFVFIGAACGSSSGDLSDKIAEKAAENASGGDVDINSEDGKVTYKDDEGNETEIDVSGDGAELPKDFPEELAPPKGVKIVSATTNTVNGEKTLYVLGEAEGTVEEFYNGLKTQLEEAGYTIENDTMMSGTDGGYAGITAKKGSTEVTASVAGGDKKDTVAISLSVTGAGS